MNGSQASMMSVQDMAELLEIRRKMDELQTRYHSIMSKYAVAGAAAPTPAPAPASTPVGLPVPPAIPVLSAAPAVAVPPAPARVVSGAQEILAALSVAAVAAPPPLSAGSPASPAAPLAGLPLRDAVIATIRNAGKPVTFERIYKDLQDGGAALPAEKPMLAVRRVLFDDTVFAANRGAYTLK